MDEKLTALVTGANRGLGKEVVRQLAMRGTRVYLCSCLRRTADSHRLSLHEFDGGDRPLAFVTSDRDSEAVEFIKPNVFYGPRLPISQDHGFANKLGLSLIEFCKDDCRSGFGGRHRVT